MLFEESNALIFYLWILNKKLYFQVRPALSYGDDHSKHLYMCIYYHNLIFHRQTQQINTITLKNNCVNKVCNKKHVDKALSTKRQNWNVYEP